MRRQRVLIAEHGNPEGPQKRSQDELRERTEEQDVKAEELSRAKLAE